MRVRIIFAGTPDAAVPTLDALLASDHDVVGVITRPPARTGRGRKVAASPVAEVARDHGIEPIETTTLRDPDVARQVAELEPELGVVVAFGALIPQDVLDLPAHGWVNLHFSDLPRWRGAAPVQRAILAGDTRTASCVFQLEKGMDTGPVFSRLPVEIGHETSGELLARMAVLGAEQVVDVAGQIAAGTAVAVPQEGEPTRAPMLTHAEGFVDFTASAAEVDCRIRAFTPNPGAWTTMPDGRRLKLMGASVSSIDEDDTAPGTVIASKREVTVACADGTAVRLGQVAPQGKGWMDAAAWARGARLPEDARLGAGEEDDR